MKALFLIVFWWSALLTTAQTANYTTATTLKDSNVQQGGVDRFEMNGEKPKKKKKKRLNTKPETIPSNGFYADFGVEMGMPHVNDHYQGVFTGSMSLGYQIADVIQLSIGTGLGTRGTIVMFLTNLKARWNVLKGSRTPYVELAGGVQFSSSWWSRALTPGILFRPAIGYRFPSTKKMHLTLDVGLSFEEHEYRIRDVNGIAQPDYEILQLATVRLGLHF